MQKIKLLLLLTLLCVGLSESWGLNYTVSYSGRTTSTGAGYKVLNTSAISTRDNATTLSTRNNLVLTSDNIWDYIEPYAVEGYYYIAEVTRAASSGIFGQNGQITITYTTNNPYFYIAYYGTGTSTNNYSTTPPSEISTADVEVLNSNLGRHTTLRRVTMNDGSDGIAAVASAPYAPEKLTTANASNYIQPVRIPGYTASIYGIEATNANWAYMYVRYATKTGGETYDVEYVGAAEHQGAGYTVNGTGALPRGRISSGESANPLVITYNSNNYPATVLTTDNILTYITPKAIPGYAVESVTVTGAKITIKYSSLSVKYRVFYDSQFVKDDNGHTAGYTVINRNLGNGVTITSEDNATVLVMTGTTTAPPSLSEITISDYLKANEVEGYTTSFYVNTGEAQLGYSGNLYVNYTATGTDDESLTWHDDLFEYSRVYTKTTGTTILLPEDEVAIRLYCDPDNMQEVTDVVYFDEPLWENPEAGQERTFTHTSSEISNGKVDGKQASWPCDGTEATYTYQGRFNGYYFYDRTHQVAYNGAKTIEIPATVSKDGKSYNVTAIQKWGFAYNQTHQIFINNCEDDQYWHDCIDNHSNWYLERVTFKHPSNMKSVGDYAFMSCTKLQSIVFPSTIEWLGQGTFEMDENLTEVSFETVQQSELQTGDDNSLVGKVRFNTIKNFTFWLCKKLEVLELPDGITEIEGQQSGASLQYMLNLKNLRLPNTLEHIGPHFLCCASSLKELTIPASVTYIDGASFHGCEGLEKVILLGPAAALQAEYHEGSEENISTTFSENSTFCKGAVSGCQFITTEDYIDSYKQDRVWSLIDEQGLSDGSTHQNTDANGNSFTVTHHNGNSLTTLPEETRTFFPQRWITAIFPHEVPNAYLAPEEYYVSGDRTSDGFGPGTKVAVMESARRIDGVEPEGSENAGKKINIYEVTFKLLEENEDGTLTIPANLPVLLYPGAEGTHVMMTVADMEDPDFKRRMYTDYMTYVEPTPQEDPLFISKIEMKGRFTSHYLVPWDFYFMYKPTSRDGEGNVTDKDYDNPAQFWRVPNTSEEPIIGACRCWWTITINGVRTNSEAKAAPGFFDDEISGVDSVENRVVLKGIYDMQGRKLDVSPDALPDGLFIVNGKKMVIKK